MTGRTWPLGQILHAFMRMKCSSKPYGVGGLPAGTPPHRVLDTVMDH